MPINKFSRYVLQDLDRAGKVDADDVTEIVGDNFLELTLTGNLKEDVLLVKEKQGATDGGLLPLRLRNGQLVSAFTLQNLLSIKMQQIAKRMMGKGGRLKNQTGRLVRSALVEPQIVNIDNTVSLQFRYMFAPYEVFDPAADVVQDGGAMKSRLATDMRSPRRLFTEALREAAKEVLYRGYNLKIAQVGVNKR